MVNTVTIILDVKSFTDDIDPCQWCNYNCIVNIYQLLTVLYYTNGMRIVYIIKHSINSNGLHVVFLPPNRAFSQLCHSGCRM